MDNSADQDHLENNQSSSVNLFRKLRNKIEQPFFLTWEGIVYFFIYLAAILTRLLGLGSRVMSHDESLHVFYSWLITTGGGYIHSPMMHGPFLFESTSLVNFLFGANDFASRLVPAVMGILIVIFIPQLLKPWIGKTGAMVGSLLLLVSPYMLYYSRYIRHDILVIAWMLLTVFAILGFLFNRKEKYLVILVTALALMFSTMEITFIYLAVFAGFLFMRMFFTHGWHCKAIKSSAEFDLLILMVTLGAFFSSTILLSILNPIFVKITGTPFVDIAVLASQGTDWIKGVDGIRLFGLLGGFTILSAIIGFTWGKTRWLKLAGLFLAICIPLFSSFFTNPAGLASGFIGSLGYWLSQQAVARGGQPWYYFLIVVPIYEYLPLIGGMGAAFYYFTKRKYLSELSSVMIPLTLWWAIGMFAALTLSGEKMPWHSTHIIVPFILLSAWWIGQLLEGNWRGYPNYKKQHEWFLRAGLISVGILFLFTVRTSFMVNYANYDYSTEFIDYAHGAPGVKWVMKDIESIGNHTGVGKGLKIAFDDEVSWPMSWYLKDYPNRTFFGAQPTRDALDAPVVLAGPKNWKKVELLLGSNYHRFEVIRLWWPIEDYRNLTWDRIWNALKNKEMRNAIMSILWQRDYTQYAKLTGEDLLPPTQWPLAEKMRIYVRKDIALQMLSLSLGSNILPETPPSVDVYAKLQRDLTPDMIINIGGLNAPRNLVVGKDGIIYIVDSGNSRVVKYNTQGELLTTWGTLTPNGQTPANPGSFNEPWGIALDQNGNVLVADTWNHRIQKFDQDGKFLMQWGVPGTAEEGLDRLWGPRGLAVSLDGKVYVTDTGNKRVVVFSSDGKPLFEFDKTGDASLDEPVGIAIGPNKNVYVADTWNMRVVIFSPEGKFLSSFPVQGWNSDSMDNKPYITVDSEGRVIVTDPEGYRVLVFSPNGDPLFTFGKYGPEDNAFGLPNGVALDSSGSLWVADAGNNRLERFSLKQP
ncbi:MAG: hypothetical protein C0410_12980 [Anaerolinea sp.]|nr:hypothetical protein [Anaerolinea sp.]